MGDVATERDPPDRQGSGHRIAGPSGEAWLEPASDRLDGAPPGAWLVRCFGEIDDRLFQDLYAALVREEGWDRLHLFVDLRAARLQFGYDGYAATARMLRLHGIRAIRAVICDDDPARTLTAKLAREVAALQGVALQYRVAARIEDAVPVFRAMLRDADAGTGRTGGGE